MSFYDAWVYATMALAAYGLVIACWQAKKLLTWGCTAATAKQASSSTSADDQRPSHAEDQPSRTVTEVRELLFAGMEAQSGESRLSARTRGSGALSLPERPSASLWVTKAGTWHSTGSCTHLEQAKEMVQVTANDDTMAVLRLVGAACKTCKKDE